MALLFARYRKYKSAARMRPWRTRNGYERLPSKFYTPTCRLRICRRSLLLVNARFRRAAPSLEKLDPVGPPAGHVELLYPEKQPDEPAKIELGRKLFFDSRLSVDGRISCASCHD